MGHILTRDPRDPWPMTHDYSPVTVTVWRLHTLGRAWRGKDYRCDIDFTLCWRPPSSPPPRCTKIVHISWSSSETSRTHGNAVPIRSGGIFKQWKRHSHAFPLEMTAASDVCLTTSVAYIGPTSRGLGGTKQWRN